MKILIKIGHIGTWYQNEAGKEFDVQDQANGYGDHKVLNSQDGYDRWINKHDFNVVENEKL